MRTNTCKHTCARAPIHTSTHNSAYKYRLVSGNKSVLAVTEGEELMVELVELLFSVVYMKTKGGTDRKRKLQ